MAEFLPPRELVGIQGMVDLDAHLRIRLVRLYVEHGLDVRDLDIAISQGRVRISGKVPDELTRLMVEDLAWSLDGVKVCVGAMRLARSAASDAFSVAL